MWVQGASTAAMDPPEPRGGCLANDGAVGRAVGGAACGHAQAGGGAGDIREKGWRLLLAELFPRCDVVAAVAALRRGDAPAAGGWLRQKASVGDWAGYATEVSRRRVLSPRPVGPLGHDSQDRSALSAEYMIMSRRSAPTICQLRSRPSRWNPTLSAVRADAAFHGSRQS